MWTLLLALILFTCLCVLEPRAVYWLLGGKVYILWNYTRYVIHALLVMLFRDRTVVLSWDEFWKRYLYGDVKECWNRPINSGPGRIILVTERYKSRATYPIEETGKTLKCINMGSYNYLGVGGRGVPEYIWNVGELQNRWDLQKEVAEATAKFLSKEYCVVVPTGYATNSSLIPCILDLCDGDSFVFSDALNHTSIVKGIQMRSGVKKCGVGIFAHGNVKDLYTQYVKLGCENKKMVLVIVEGLYSMEGDYAPLRELVELKRKLPNLYLYVDEAHSIGALGKTGRGICERLKVDPRSIDFLMGTFTKSFASIGGYVTFQDQALGAKVEYLYRTRYSKDLTPLHATCARQILGVFKWLDTKEGHQAIARLRNSSIYLRTKLRCLGCEILGEHDSPIVPFVMQEVHHVETINRLFLKCRVAVVSVGYPATPLIDGCRLRFCVSANHKTSDLDELALIMEESMNLLGMVRNICIPEPTMDSISLPPQVRIFSPVSSYYTILPIGICRTYPSIDAKTEDGDRMLLEERLDEATIQVLRSYGCGSCGPRGFYGTTNLHIELEKALATFYNREDAALYSHGQCVASSVIPQLVENLGGAHKVKIVIPRYWIPRYDVEMAFRLSKTRMAFFTDIDTVDQYIPTGVVVGAIEHLLVVTPDFNTTIQNWKHGDKNGSVTWVIDAFARPLGDTRTHPEPDVILGTLETPEIGAMGGFCVGKTHLVEPQRLYAKSYVYSASLPPYLCQIAMNKLKELSS